MGGKSDGGYGKSDGGWGKSAKGKSGGGPYGDAGKGGKSKGKGKEGGKKGGKGKLSGFPPEQKVWVGSLSGGTTQESLQEHFAITGGTVAAAVVMRSGTACVVYSSEEEAQ